MTLFIAGLIVLLAAATLLEAGLLVFIEKLFKLENPTYKNALKIVLFYTITSTAVWVIFTLIDLGFVSYVLTTVAAFLIFHFFLKKYQLSSWKRSLGIFVVFGIVNAVVSLSVVVPVRLYVFEPFVVSGAAMSPTYSSGDYLFINKFNRSYERGDVVVFEYPEDPSKVFIKRIVALPSETIDIKGGQVLINGKVLQENYYTGETLPDHSITLTADQYFVLGDNRSASSDSRNWGPVTKEGILGKVSYRAFNLNI